MKFTLRALLILLVVSIANCNELTEDENQNRLLQCGKEMPHESDESLSSFVPAANSWIVRVMLRNPDQTFRPEFTMGGFISPRHILTSSQVVSKTNSKWFWDDTAKFGNNTTVIVPLEAAKSLNFTVIARVKTALGNAAGHIVKRAWMLDYLNGFFMHSAMMLIELTADVPEVQYPCLGGAEDVTATEGAKVHAFGFHQNRSSSLVDHRVMQVNFTSGADSRWIHVNHYPMILDRGGPMVKYEDGKVTIVGVAASSEQDNNYSRFFKTANLNNEICKLSGVCDVPIITTTPETTTPETTTPEPTTPEPTPPEPTTVTVARIPAAMTKEEEPADETAEPNKDQKIDLYFLICLIVVSMFYL